MQDYFEKINTFSLCIGYVWEIGRHTGCWSSAFSLDLCDASMKPSPKDNSFTVKAEFPAYRFKYHCYCAVLCLVTPSCLTLCNPLDCSPPGSSVHGDSPDKNTRMGCHSLLQGIFPTQGLNPGLRHCRQILYHLSHQGNPKSQSV